MTLDTFQRTEAGKGGGQGRAVGAPSLGPNLDGALELLSGIVVALKVAKDVRHVVAQRRAVGAVGPHQRLANGERFPIAAQRQLSVLHLSRPGPQLHQRGGGLWMLVPVHLLGDRERALEQGARGVVLLEVVMTLAQHQQRRDHLR